MAEQREGIEAASPSSSKPLLQTLKSIHFKLVTATRRLREGSNANTEAFSGLAERVATLGGEFRAAVQRADASERETRCPEGKAERRFQSWMSSTPCCWNRSAHFHDLWSFLVRTKHPEKHFTSHTVHTNPSPRSTCPICLVTPWRLPTQKHPGHDRSNACVRHIRRTSCRYRYRTIP